MKRHFKDEILNPQQFVITLELIPGAESRGRSVDAVKSIAADAMTDGRLSAVTITDNPGGNPRLSPDVVGKEILELGMDVIVHFTCRDMNRAGIESRSLQLSRMGMQNILALNGDYSGKGFGGQGAPVFDLDSVNLICMFNMLSRRADENLDHEEFFVGCAVSPFKSKEAECFSQYYKLCRKMSSGARFVITQLGYDVRKFHELLQVQNHLGIILPTLGSVYLLTPQAARIMHDGGIPGAVVTKKLLDTVNEEWKDKNHGRTQAIERCARLGVILKGLGYQGIHIGGVHKSFEIVGKILDRMEEIEDCWRDFLPLFEFPQENGYYIFEKDFKTGLNNKVQARKRSKASPTELILFQFFRVFHHIFFRFEAPFEPFYAKLCSWLDRKRWGHFLIGLAEDPIKKLFLFCQKCGDCGIQHVGFLCPESQCPKHIRNGACGGSRNGTCEVNTERPCVWVRVYDRLNSSSQINEMTIGCVPPRMWELNQTSAWLNYHLRRDHQSVHCAISQFCGTAVCAVQKSRAVGKSDLSKNQGLQA